MTPILGAILCIVFMMGPILLDIVSKGIGVDLLGEIVGSPDPHFQRDPVAFGILIGYIVVGVILYTVYGRKHSKLRHGVRVTGHEPKPMQAP